MVKTIVRAVLLTLSLECPLVHSQVLPFRNYTSRDGLLSNYSLALCNDSRGYLWIGSNDGFATPFLVVIIRSLSIYFGIHPNLFPFA